MKTEDMLEEQIQKDLQKLDNFEAGSQERGNCVEDVKTLYNILLEEKKLKQQKEEADNKLETDIMENDFKNEQLKQQTWFNWVQLGVTFGLGIIGKICIDCWHRRELNFETDGGYHSTQTGKTIINKMFSKND